VDSNKFIYRYMPDGKKYQKLHDGYYAADDELLFDGPAGKATLEIQRNQISGKGYAKIPGKAPAPKPETVSPAARKDPKEPAEDAAELYRKGGERYKSKDYKAALPYYLQAADAGYAPAQFSLGIMYESGYGVNKNYAEAVSWFRKAAAQGYASAQFSLGVMYRYGDGVNRNYAESVSWFRKAAAQGHAYAQYNLGGMYENGDGINRDYTEAVSWYRKAAAQGNTGAKEALEHLKKEGKIPK
jgi:TPR repeat protein